MNQVCLGMVGGGYAAFLHLNGYRNVHGVSLRLKTVVDIDQERAKSTAEKYGFENTSAEFDDLLRDPDINVIDICTPPHLHIDMAKKALAAGKHVICEKPLTGYFGREGDKQPVGTVPKARMLEALLGEMDSLKAVVESSGKRFMYAENYVYATPVQKAAEFIRAKKSRILFIKGEESLRGSSSAVAGEWKYTGGGVLIRAGIHPVGGALWLKSQEAKARGVEIKPVSVMAEVGQASKALSEKEHRYITANPQDVEDFASVTVGFSDGSRMLIISSDTVLGGTQNYLQVYCNDAAFDCRITPTDLLNTFFMDEEDIKDVYHSEMTATRIGWNKTFTSDEIIRGYAGELQDFLECAATGREPEAGFDLAYQTIKIIYAAYQSAEEGRRIDL